MAETVRWLDQEFTVYVHSANWHQVPGLYIFAGQNSQGQWYPLYIGKAESLAERLPTHERWTEAAQLGATRVHARVEQQKAKRAIHEKQLIQYYQPRLNLQLKS